MNYIFLGIYLWKILFSMKNRVSRDRDKKTNPILNFFSIESNYSAYFYIDVSFFQTPSLAPNTI